MLALSLQALNTIPQAEGSISHQDRDVLLFAFALDSCGCMMTCAAGMVRVYKRNQTFSATIYEKEEQAIFSTQIPAVTIHKNDQCGSV